MPAEVEVRSDGAYAGRPLAVHWQGRRYPVAEVLSEWRTPAGKHYRVRAEAGPVFELSYLPAADEWQVRIMGG